MAVCFTDDRAHPGWFTGSEQRFEFRTRRRYTEARTQSSGSTFETASSVDADRIRLMSTGWRLTKSARQVHHVPDPSKLLDNPAWWLLGGRTPKDRQPEMGSPPPRGQQPSARLRIQVA